MPTTPRSLLAALACATLLLVPVARGQSLPASRALTGGGLARVAIEEGRPVLERLRNGVAEWKRSLPAMPRFLQTGASGAVAVGSIRFDVPGASWATVFAPDGESWSVPGSPRRVHLSADGRRVLIQTRYEGRGLTRVHEVGGERVAELPIELAEHVSVELSKAGDAVLVAPGGEDPSTEISVYDLESGRLRWVEMPGDESAEQAIAIDATRLVTLGGGTLRFHDLQGEGASWGRHPAPGYSTLLGVSRDGRRILVSLGGGAYDLLDSSGEVVWAFRPAAPAPELRSALAAVDDLRQIQIELLAEGDLLLRDRSSQRRYLVHSPGAAGVRVQPVPAGTLVAPDGGLLDGVG